MTMPNVEDFLHPIDCKHPVGEDARHDHAYDAMESEVKKFGSLFNEVVDWHIVREHSEHILRHLSKDLKAACYLSRAWVEHAGIEGLEAGLTLIHELLTGFGQELFPRRQRAREGAIDWLESQLKNVMVTLCASVGDKAQLSNCQALLDRVQLQYQTLFPSSDIDLIALKPLLDNGESNDCAKLTPAQPAPPKEKAAEQELPQTDVSGSSKLAQPDISPTVESHVSTNTLRIEDIKQPLKTSSEFLMRSDVGSGLIYRINRFLSWIDISELPGSDKNGVTQLSLAVSEESLSRYANVAVGDESLALELIPKLEATLLNTPFWITGHYYLYKMLNQGDYHDAANAVQHEAQVFVRRLSGIETLMFKNEVPFACDETKSWLSQENQTKVQHDTCYAPVQEIDVNLVKSKHVSIGSLGLQASELSQQLGANLSGRSQFLLYLNMIQAFHQVELFSLCLPYLESLWQIKEDMNLTQWEPQLCLLLDPLTDKTLSALFSDDRAIPKKYKAWMSV
ncbi:type VI secretion system protein TssA [Vibrio sp. S4M6]|uniref:type VI secretion system protein TssA n=1 Tax=Vibrio sinus TaxID=2946865 RepID=UPI00202A8DB9|nr:type VI secretion system protein TssA [Vibrio sinus]MCL9783485.1 type VI secretion system protein TssA [Vibrio sinus]